MNTVPFTVSRVQALCFRYPLVTPVVTSFGSMLSRPAVFVRVEDDEGYVGWGEVWSNFPLAGAEHRARLVNEVLGPSLCGRRASGPAEVFEWLTEDSAVLALQAGEPGPFAQSIAGIDLALWDLYARRCNMPLWRLLGGADPAIKVYASGINPRGSRQMAEGALARGHRALKLKVGFDLEIDLANLRALRDLQGDDLLAADANQAWSIERAIQTAPELTEFGLAWLEEPIRADRPWSDWRRLKDAVEVPLAAGENIASRTGFEQALGEGVLQVVQPDIAKWGGFTLGAEVGRSILKAGRIFCPHYLGGGIGLLASAHLLAGVGGGGLLEIDANENPLRDHLCGPVFNVTDGMVTLNEHPGLGIEPKLSLIEQYRTA